MGNSIVSFPFPIVSYPNKLKRNSPLQSFTPSNILLVAIQNQADVTFIALVAHAPYCHRPFLPAICRCEESLAKDEARGLIRICSILAAHRADRCHRQAANVTLLAQGANRESRSLVEDFAV